MCNLFDGGVMSIDEIKEWLDEWEANDYDSVGIEEVAEILRRVITEPTIATESLLTRQTKASENELLKNMAMAHDAEDAAQRGEPSPWAEGDLDPEWVSERIACMRAAMIAAAQEGEK